MKKTHRTPVHDLDLPLIGPYSRRFIGAAQITDRAKGRLMVYPLSISLEGGNSISWTPEPASDKWSTTDAAEDLSSFALRYYLKGQTDVLANAYYRVLDNKRFLCRIILQNNTAQQQRTRIRTAVLREWEEPQLKFNFPKKSIVVDAAKYSRISAYHQYALDGERICVRHAMFTHSGRVLGGHFGEWPGDRVEYSFSTKAGFKSAYLVIRYAKRYDNVQRYKIMLDGQPVEAAFERTTSEHSGLSSWKYLKIPIGNVAAGRHRLSMEVLEPQNRFLEKQYERNLYAEPSGKDAQKATSFALDFFCLTEGSPDPSRWVKGVPSPAKPFGLVRGASHALIQDRFSPKPDWFACGFLSGKAEVMPLHERFGFREYMDNHNVILAPAPKGLPAESTLNVHGADISMDSIEIPPHGTREFLLFGLRVKGKEEALRDIKKLRNLALDWPKAKGLALETDFKIQDQAYGPSVAHEVAYLMGNVSFPNRLGDHNVITNAADKFRFPTFYSWDAGMITVGQAQCSLKRAEEHIHQYLLTRDPKQPLLQHGTILPTQIYALWEIFQRTGNKNVLSTFYSAARKAYTFYVGRHPLSATLRNGDDFINASNSFYNAIGMDDYPVQQYCAEQNMLSHAAMPETNASAIRFGRILEMCALLLGHKKHLTEYRTDRKRFAGALEKLWDERSAYYGWMVGDRLLRSEDGDNYNKGISGVYPIITNMLNTERNKKLIAQIKTPGRLWSHAGVSTVDQSASYYSPNGYWNGRVWMPHQWIFWKSMLDLGEIDFARQIAFTALETWSRNETRTGMCYENFRIDTGEGGGATHFTALSSVVVNFYCAYFRPQSISTGFDVFVTSKEIDVEKGRARISFSSPLTKPHRTGAVVVMKPNTRYRVNGNVFRSDDSGALSFGFAINGRKAIQIESAG